MKLIPFLLIIIISVLSDESFSQWESAASFNTKNDIPKKGVGIQVGRNLPIQAPNLGVKVRFDAQFFRGKNSLQINNSVSNTEFVQNDFHLELIAAIFPKIYQPYAGLGVGISFINIEDESDNSLLLSALAGLEFSFSNSVIPFLEFQAIRYLKDFKYTGLIDEINNIQFKGLVGLRFRINLIN